MSQLSETALIIVDVQNDFMPDGPLPVPGGNEIINAVNTLSQKGFKAVIATRDWHPANHCSFQPEGGLWPPHCIAGTEGADFPSQLDLSPVTHIIHKGTSRIRDSYSAFFDNDHRTTTGLDQLLQSLNIAKVIVCGLALDYCVKFTAQDARHCGFDVEIPLSATRGISQDNSALFNDFKESGIVLTK